MGETAASDPGEDRAPAADGRARPRAWRVGSPQVAIAGVTLCLAVAAATYRAAFTSGRDAIARADAQRLEYFAGSLQYALEKNEHLPFLIGLERDVLALLRAPGDPRLVERVNRYLALVQSRAGVAAAYVIDRDGLTLAASNAGTPGSFVGGRYGNRPYFREAIAGGTGRFYGVGLTTGAPGFFLSAPVRDGAGIAGVITVKVSLDGVEQAWAQSGERLLLADEHGVVFLASAPAWKYTALAPLAPEALARIADTGQYGGHRIAPLTPGAALRPAGGAQALTLALPAAGPQPARPAARVLLQARPTGARGWHVLMVSDLQPARATALGAAAAAGFGAAFALTAAFYLHLRRSRHRERLQASAALQRVHAGLERRIAERTAALVQANDELAERVDALKEAERILRETQDGAVQAGKLAVLGQMAAGLTHELNQPLAALTTLQDNAARLLELGRLDEARENLRRTSQLSQKMGGIVGQFKAFARKAPVSRAPVRVADALAQALQLVEPLRRAARVEIAVRQPDPELRALADAVRLEQVLVNLLRNGVEAMEEAPARRLEVTVDRTGGRVRVAIRDHGPGISPEVRPRLFEPFFTTKPTGVGLGLGLAISRTIAEGLGGELVAGDAAGGGAEFVLALEEA